MDLFINFIILLTALVADRSLRILAQDATATAVLYRPARQGTSQWSFDPFLNKYYVIDLASRVNMSEFAVADGIPASAVAGGEHQYYNISADGLQYVQNVFYPSGAEFGSAIHFVLGQETTVSLPNNVSVRYTFDMLNATTIKVNLDRTFSDGHHGTFEIHLVFRPDGSGFDDTVSILSPSVFGAHAIFNLGTPP